MVRAKAWSIGAGLGWGEDLRTRACVRPVPETTVRAQRLAHVRARGSKRCEATHYRITLSTNAWLVLFKYIMDLTAVALTSAAL